MIIFHHNDADGRCAAAIVQYWWEKEKDKPANNGFLGHPGDNQLRWVEMDYKMPCPVDQIRRDETVVIVDFSFKPDVMRQIQAATDIGVIWCDHHASAKDYGYDVPGERDFSEKGKSGCEVTWKFFFPNDPCPPAVVLLGDYDAWRLEDAPRCFQFYEGLKLYRTGEYPVWYTLIADTNRNFENSIVSQGRTAIEYRDMYCAEIRKSFGYETEIDGVKAFALNTARFGSQAFGENFKKYPICIMFIFDGKQWTVSLYSETVDVSVICKNHGGGGHKGAAGFVCQSLPF